MDLKDLAAVFEALSERITGNNPELVRRVSVTTLNVMRNHTPPNPGHHATKRENYNPTRESVKKLRQRICEEIVGGAAPATAVPSNEEAPRPIDVQGETGWGGYGFVVPRGNTRKRKIRFVDPEDVLRRRKWRRSGNAYRARRHARDVSSGFFFFTSRSALNRAVQRRLKRAGALIGGWSHAMQALGGKMAGFTPSKERRGGRGYWQKTAGGVGFVAENDWGELIVAKRYRREFDTFTGYWAQGNVKNVKMWYFKGLGLDDIAKIYKNKNPRRKR